MKKLRLLVPVSVIAAVVLLLMAPAGALAAPSDHHGGWNGDHHGGWYGDHNGGWNGGDNGGWNGEHNGGWNGEYNGGWNGEHNGGWNGEHNGGWNGEHNGGWNGEHNGGFWYTVKCGDTLGDLGWRYGSSALELAEINDIENPDLIYRGQTLWIPEDDW